MKKQFVILIFLAVLMMVISGCGESFASGEIFTNSIMLVSEAKDGITEIFYDDFKLMLESKEECDDCRLILIDVREPYEFEEGYINQPDENDEYPYMKTYTVNIPRGLLEFKIGDKKYWDNDLCLEMPQKDESMVVYSNGGKRVALAVYSLMQLGYTNVMGLKGGYRIWLDPTLPLEEEVLYSGG